MRAFFSIVTIASLLFFAMAENAYANASLPGENFWDCDGCPEMIVVGKGNFVMGDANGREDEKPARQISITKPFAIGAFEVTFAEWQACVDDGGCQQTPDDLGWGKIARPVIGVSWLQAQRYTAWLSSKSGQTYRLPTEEEWEYAARAGTKTQYWWGDRHEDGEASFCGSKWDTKRTAPVGTFPANPFGLYDVHGNVWEWVEGCYQAGEDNSNCRRVIRGGSWQTYPLLLRSARRQPARTDGQYSDVGFRVVREVN